ncbi:MAG: hypothetical protein J0H78_10635 [Rhizobiales bacterium]|nr:hypothetical protein [Hyphomicrobiales bacterium]OJY46477.1 MAG: hypothetical protein BGP08_15575 [Rhizobiales bacterium 64-17]
MGTRGNVVMAAIGDTLASIGKALYGAWYTLESWTIIPLAEILMRLWYRLDPRVYSERLRVRSVTAGKADKKSQKYAVLVIYTNSPLASFTANMINAIGRSDINLVVVANGPITPLLRAQLLDACYVLIERSNVGRDFGAYKDAANILMRSEKDVDRLILMNDSMFFFERGLGKLIADLDGEDEFIGLTEVFEYHYHVQSFLLSFGFHAVRSRAFRKFWKSYKPIGTRRWSIHKGEVSLTRHMTKAGFRPHILFQAAQLIPHLRPRPVRDVLESVRLLPSYCRPLLYREFDTFIGAEGFSATDFEAISQGVRPIGPSNRPAGLPGIHGQLETMDRWNFEIFGNRLISLIAKRNQVHVGGFLFMKYLGLPAIKRDIFYRSVYSLEEVYRILSDFNEPLRDEVMADLRRAGTSMHFKGLRRILHSHGSI